MSGPGGRFRHLVRWQLTEVLHQRVLWVLSGVALAVASSGAVWRTFHFGADEPRFRAGVALAGLWSAGTMLAALLAPVLIGPPGECRLAHCLFSRGVRRGEWVGSVFAALGVVQGWLLLLIGAALAGLALRHGQGPALAPALLLLAAQTGGLLVVCAAAVLMAVIFRRALAATAATIGFSLAMQAEPLFSRMAAAARGGEALVWHGLDLLVPGGAALDGFGGLGAACGVAGYLLVFLGMAVAIHAQREI